MMSTNVTHSIRSIFLKFLPFWIFLTFFKFGGGLHYSLISPLGEKLLPLWLIGLLMGGASLVQLLLDVPAGRILDRYGYRKFLKITTLTFLFAAISLSFGFTKVTYLLSIAISTFGWLFFGPGVNAYILSHAPKESSGRFISLRDVFGSVGVVLSSASLPFVIALAPTQIGYIIFVLLFVAFALLFFSPKDHRSVHEEIKIPTQHHYIRRHSTLALVKIMRKLNPASTMLLLLQLSGSIFYGIIWFVVPLMIAHQANSGLLGIGLGIFDFAVVVLGFLLGNLADKGNKRTLVFLGLLIFAISGMFIGFNFGWLFILFGFLATSGDEMAGISLWSWLHSLDKEHAHDGAVAGVINLFQDLGWAIGPIVAGLVYGVAGASWTITIGAIPIFLTWVFYQFMARNQKGLSHLPLSMIPAKPHRMRHKT